MALITQSSAGAAFSSLLAPFTSIATATVRPLKAITAAELATLREGDIVYVQNLRDYWKWLPLSAIASNDITYCAPTVVGVGLGRFERLNLASPDWMLQKTWVLASTGADENDGLTLATALLTDEERQRRWGPAPLWDGSSAYHIRLLSDNYTVLLKAGACQANSTLYIHASMTDRNGTGIGAFAGAATTVTALNTAANTAPQIVSATVPVSWTASGLIGKRLRLTSGANINALSWVQFDLGGAAPAAQGQLTEFITPVASFTTAPFSKPAVATAAPANGDTFIVENLRICNIVCDIQPGPSVLVSPDNAGGNVKVVLDSLSATLSGNAFCAFYADGCEIATVTTFSGGVEWLHNIKFASAGVMDRGRKVIEGGFSSSDQTLLSPSLSGGDVNRVIFRGGRLRLVGSGGYGGCWRIRQLGLFGILSSTASGCLVIADSGCNVTSTTVLWGSGNTTSQITLNGGAILLNNAVLTAAQFPIASTAVFMSLAATKTTSAAWDVATNLFTASRALSLANLLALVSGGGFCSNTAGIPTFFDPETKCGMALVTS